MNVGVVGLGYWGPNLVRNFAENNLVGEIWCCDLVEKRLNQIKQRYPAVQTTQSFKDLVMNPKIDAIAVATNISTHHPLAREVLESEKHVFVEKPFAASVEEAKSLIELAGRKNKKIMVGHTFEYSPPVVKIKTILETKQLGKIYYISSSRVNLGLHQKDVSVIWDLAPHDFSILFFWLNEIPVRISALGKDYVQKGIPDVAFINMEFASGITAHVQVSWLSPSKLRRTTIVGSEKMLVYDDTESMEKVKIFDKGVNYKDPQTFGEYQLSYRAGDIISPQLENYEPLSAEVNHFIDCILNDRSPKSDGASGLRVVRALEAAEKSLRNKGRMEEIYENK